MIKIRDFGVGLALATTFSIANGFHANAQLKEQVAEGARTGLCADRPREVSDWLGNRIAFKVTQCSVTQHPADPNGACVQFNYSRPTWSGPGRARACTKAPAA